MGLKNKNSIFDLVAGNNPVEDMNLQQGPTFQQPTDVASQVHIDSLQSIVDSLQNKIWDNNILNQQSYNLYKTNEYNKIKNMK